MKKIRKSLLFISLFLLSGLFATNVFAQTTTPNPFTIDQTEVTFIMKVNQDYYKNAGILFSTKKDDVPYSFLKCQNLISHSDQFLVKGNDYTLKITGLKKGTTYYYTSCATDSTLDKYLPGETKSFTTKNLTDGTMIETLDALNISHYSAEILGKINTAALSDSGFKIAENKDLTSLACAYTNKVHVVGGTHRETKKNLKKNTTYYYQFCAKNTAGKEFIGGVKQFKTKDQSANEVSSMCTIDYVEFTPYNKSLTEAKPGNPRFETFIVGEGTELKYTVHPENKANCAGIPIHTIRLVNYSKGENNISVEKSLVEFGDGKKFSEEGLFSGRLVAGDKNCNEEKICTLDLMVVYGVWPGNAHLTAPSNARTFLSSRTSNYGGYSTGSTELKRNKGTVYYRAKTGDKEWKIFEEGKDPSYTDTQKNSPDPDSPCYIKTGENAGTYDKNCYEFLAPIHGINKINGTDGSLVNDPAYTEENGRIAIKNIRDYELGTYLNKIFQVAIAILGVLAVIMIIVAGVQYMTVESIYGKSDAKERIGNAVGGLILALGIFVILNTINPRLLEINFGEGIESASVDVKTVDISYLNTINTSGIPNVDLGTMMNNNAFIVYIAHQQGKGGASAILYSLKEKSNKVVKSKYTSNPAKIQKNIDNQFKKPTNLDDFANYFYKRIIVFSKDTKNRNLIPKEYTTAIKKVSNETGVDFETMITMCMIESYMCTKNVDNGQGYRGLFQFGESAWKDYGSGKYLENVFDPYQNALAAAKMFKANSKITI